MALNAFLKLKGEKQGEIKGSVTQKGREGKIMVTAASHEVIIPRDIVSGLPVGRHTHKPFVITKPLDKSSLFVVQRPGKQRKSDRLGTAILDSCFKRCRRRRYRKTALHGEAQQCPYYRHQVYYAQ